MACACRSKFSLILLLSLIHILLLPFRKLPLPFLALIEGQNIREDAACYRLDPVLGNICLLYTSTNLCCVSLRAAAGLNLQRASCVVFGELDWSPAVHSLSLIHI